MLTVKIERSRYTLIEECLYGVTVITPKHEDFARLVVANNAGKDVLAFLSYDSPECETRHRKMLAEDKVYIMNDIGKTIDTLYFNSKSK